ncbi:MAG TPA: adenylate/guanylate cyclase domain-containing protein [Rhizomicrobium sp.]|jgi:adenylate cyclase|nr:adenylate/guanylate cyclase domain-containing protein [Rhizomicrobium sp.]
MRAGAKPISVWALPLAVLVAAGLVMFADPGGLTERLRGLQFDAYQTLQPRPYEDGATKVRVLDADPAAMTQFGPWPWSRLALAKLTDQLKIAGASTVVFAFPLDNTDPAAPGHLADLLPAGDPARAALSGLPVPDARFAQSLAGMSGVTGFTLGDTGDAAPRIKSTLAFEGDAEALRAVPDFASASAAPTEIGAASAGQGALNIIPDVDGTVRRMPLVFRLDGRPVPALDAEVLRLAAGTDLTIAAAATGIPGVSATSALSTASAGKYDAPLLADGTIAIYFSRGDAARHIAASALDKLSPGALDHAIVILAPPDETVMTPFGRRNIADVHAEALENILLGTTLKEPNGRYPGLIFLLVMGIGLAVLFLRAGARWAGALALLTIVGLEGFTWFLFSREHILLDSTSPAAGLLLVFVAGFGARLWEIAQARIHFREIFAGALGDAAIEKIAHQPELLKLGGEARIVTCLSCGIRGYARLSDSFADDAPGFAKLIGSAVAPLVQVALASGGTLGRFDGESFTAYWNAPLDDPEHALHACEAANRMMLALAQTNETLAQERRFDGTAFEAIEVGVGISTGRAVAGGFGARGAYAVAGDCMVLADRIRTLSAQYGPAIVVGEDTRKAAERGYAFLEVDYITAGPHDQAVKLYAMLGNPLVRASPKFRALQTFHDHIFQAIHDRQWEKARGLIEQCRKLSGASQKLYDLHLARIDYFEDNPPGADWDGAFRQILK